MIGKDLRRIFIDRRHALPNDARVRASQHVMQLFTDHISLPSESVVAGYWPVRGEVDDFPLLRALAARGHRIALPQVLAKNAPLVFRAYRDGDNMVAGMYDIPVPVDGAIVVPDVILVPLVAFDGYGRRLGYGGGFYDRTLAQHATVQAVGLAFDCQYADDNLPEAAHDIRLGTVITDTKIYRF